jgi:hypothetical protein
LKEGFFTDSMEVGIEVDAIKVMSHLLHQIWMHIQGSKHRKYLQDKHEWMMLHGTVLTGKVWSLDTCLLDLWNESRLQKVCMVCSIQGDRNQRHLQMPSTHISVWDVKNQMKCRSTFWNSDMSVLMQKDMILSIQWWGRYDRTTYVQSKKCYYMYEVLTWISGNSYTRCEQFTWIATWITLKGNRWPRMYWLHLAMRGYLSKSWGLAVSANHHLDANNDKGEAWVWKTVLQLWTFTNEMWEHRNSVLHNT